MPFPTLFQLAAKSVAQRIHDETISLDFPLDTKSSNAIVRELLKLDGNNFKKLEVFNHQLSVTEINLRGCEIDAEAVRNLSNFNLDSLDFGDLVQLEDDFPSDPWDVGTFDIVSLLIKSTNNYSRKSMIHLGLSTEQEFIAGWETEVSEFFPNLQSMIISYKTFNERFQFSNFCTFFPNLLVLDISDPLGLSSLQGIKNLKNLQKLTMHFVQFDDINGYKELSELKNLKYLDVASTSVNWDEIHPIRGMLAAGVRMEALEFLDCSWTPVTEYELETFAKNHPSLKTVAVLCTACNHTTISGVKMLNMSSMSSLSESLEYTLLTDRHELSISLFSTDIPDMIELFYNVFHKNFSTSDQEETAGIIYQMLEATVNAVRPGILIPDRVSKFVLEKTFDLDRQFPEHRNQATRIICQALVWMTLEQHLKMSLNFELFSKVTVFLNSTFVL